MTQVKIDELENSLTGKNTFYWERTVEEVFLEKLLQAQESLIDKAKQEEEIKKLDDKKRLRDAWLKGRVIENETDMLQKDAIYETCQKNLENTVLRADEDLGPVPFYIEKDRRAVLSGEEDLPSKDKIKNIRLDSVEKLVQLAKDDPKNYQEKVLKLFLQELMIREIPKEAKEYEKNDIIQRLGAEKNLSMREKDVDVWRAMMQGAQTLLGTDEFIPFSKKILETARRFFDPKEDRLSAETIFLSEYGLDYLKSNALEKTKNTARVVQIVTSSSYAVVNPRVFGKAETLLKTLKASDQEMFTFYRNLASAKTDKVIGIFPATMRMTGYTALTDFMRQNPKFEKQKKNIVKDILAELKTPDLFTLSGASKNTGEGERKSLEAFSYSKERQNLWKEIWSFLDKDQDKLQAIEIVLDQSDARKKKGTGVMRDRFVEFMVKEAKEFATCSESFAEDLGKAFEKRILKYAQEAMVDKKFQEPESWVEIYDFVLKNNVVKEDFYNKTNEFVLKAVNQEDQIVQSAKTFRNLSVTNYEAWKILEVGVQSTIYQFDRTDKSSLLTNAAEFYQLAVENKNSEIAAQGKKMLKTLQIVEKLAQVKSAPSNDMLQEEMNMLVKGFSYPKRVSQQQDPNIIAKMQELRALKIG